MRDALHANSPCLVTSPSVLLELDIVGESSNAGCFEYRCCPLPSSGCKLLRYLSEAPGTEFLLVICVPWITS